MPLKEIRRQTYKSTPTLEVSELAGLQQKLLTGGVIHSDADKKIFQCAIALVAEKNYKYIWKDSQLELVCKSSGAITIVSGSEVNKVTISYGEGGNLLFKWKDKGYTFTIRRSALASWDQLKTSIVQFILGNVYGGLYAGRPLQGAAKDAVEWSKK
ncbi:uncharacterized protein LOC144360057 [Saccoglossus kowalevskii]